MPHPHVNALARSALLCAAACADDLPLPTSTAKATVPVTTATVGTTFETTIDATKADAWIGFDFENPGAGELNPKGMDWDLAFQRFKIKSNGGVSGSAGAEVAVVPDVGLDALMAAPAAGWLRDEADGPDTNEDPDTVFNRSDDGWFSYDGTSHMLSPRRRTYVVATGQRNHFALELVRYYDAAGTAGMVTFRWKPLTAAARP